MVFLLLALVSATIGAIPALIAHRFFKFILLAVIYFFISLGLFYVEMPCLEYSWGGGVAAWILLLSVYTAIFCMRYRKSFQLSLTIPAILIIVVVLFTLISGCGAFNTRKYSALVGDMGTQGKTLKYWTQQNQEISPSHIRIVPQEHAIAIGKTALNQHADEKGNIVGSQFETAEDYTTLQKVNSDLFYVIPLDYRSWGSYNGAAGVPGFVMINAEDQHVNPKYINGFTMKFTPGAYFGANLERHLYTNGYCDKVLTDYSFEVDDSLKPYWVVTVCHHTIGMFSGLVVDGVAIVDPVNGAINYYPKNKVPAWVDRVMPMDIVHNNLAWWGAYLNGYWNSTFIGAAKNLRKPESTLLNYGSDGTCWYVTPLTSNNNNDNTMTDLVYTNSRTGESHRYVVSGATEDAIAATVDATVKFQNLHASAIIYENVSDRLTALVTILAEDHSIRGLALVDVMTKNLSWDPDPTTALMKYQNSLGALGGALGTDVATTEREFTGKLDRIHETASATGSIFYLYFKGVPHVFTVPQTFHKVLVTEPGDSVKIRYLAMDADLIGVNYFDNLNIDLSLSRNQKEALSSAGKRLRQDSVYMSSQSAKNDSLNKGH